MSPLVARRVVLVIVLGALAAGGVFFSRSFRPPDGSGREANIADAPAGGRTQATLPPADTLLPPPIEPLEDPLQPGVSEAPDVPSSAAHRGVKKIGERIRDAVLADGRIGDVEVPGVDLAGLTLSQRRRFLDEAVDISCGCGCGQDLLECRRDDLSCPTSPGIRDSLLAVVRKSD